jgi:hypothetical protein
MTKESVLLIIMQKKLILNQEKKIMSINSTNKRQNSFGVIIIKDIMQHADHPKWRWMHFTLIIAFMRR